LTSFDVRKIRINKKGRDFYETLTTDQEANLTNQEIYVPLAIAELVPNELIEEEDVPLAIAKVDQTQVIEEELNEKKLNKNIKIVRIG
jgi:hypothetical protein